MKNMIRCSACGRRRKPGHEARVGIKDGQKKSYSDKCVSLAQFRKDNPRRKEK